MIPPMAIGVFQILLDLLSGKFQKIEPVFIFIQFVHIADINRPLPDRFIESERRSKGDIRRLSDYVFRHVELQLVNGAGKIRWSNPRTVVLRHQSNKSRPALKYCWQFLKKEIRYLKICRYFHPEETNAVWGAGSSMEGEAIAVSRYIQPKHKLP